jgi:ribosomal protein L19E
MAGTRHADIDGAASLLGVAGTGTDRARAVADEPAVVDRPYHGRTEGEAARRCRPARFGIRLTTARGTGSREGSRQPRNPSSVVVVATLESLVATLTSLDASLDEPM